jgi:hypothetical protein
MGAGEESSPGRPAAPRDHGTTDPGTTATSRAPGGNRWHTRYTVTLPMRSDALRPVTHPLHTVTRVRHEAVVEMPTAAAGVAPGGNRRHTRYTVTLPMRNGVFRPVTYPLHPVTRARHGRWWTCHRLLCDGHRPPLQGETGGTSITPVDYQRLTTFFPVKKLVLSPIPIQAGFGRGRQWLAPMLHRRCGRAGTDHPASHDWRSAKRGGIHLHRRVQ